MKYNFKCPFSLLVVAFFWFALYRSTVTFSGNDTPRLIVHCSEHITLSVLILLPFCFSEICFVNLWGNEQSQFIYLMQQSKYRLCIFLLCPYIDKLFMLAFFCWQPPLNSLFLLSVIDQNETCCSSHSEPLVYPNAFKLYCHFLSLLLHTNNVLAFVHCCASSWNFPWDFWVLHKESLG